MGAKEGRQGGGQTGVSWDIHCGGNARNGEQSGSRGRAVTGELAADGLGVVHGSMMRRGAGSAFGGISHARGQQAPDKGGNDIA